MIISDVSNLIISSNNFEIDLPSIVNNSPVLTSALEIPHSYKSSEIFFKRPAKEDIYATFTFTENEIQEIKRRIATEKEITVTKIISLTSKDTTITYCEVHKVIYIANKLFYKEKVKQRNA